MTYGAYNKYELGLFFIGSLALTAALFSLAFWAYEKTGNAPWAELYVTLAFMSLFTGLLFFKFIKECARDKRQQKARRV